MNSRILIFLCVVLAIAYSYSLTKLKVDIKSKQLIDADGNIIILHGANVAYKNPPYIPPETSKFDLDKSFSNEDAILLKSLGMNFIRLTFYWEGVEPERNKYDEKYIDLIENIVKICEKNNIYVLLDLHQDSASKKFCGEGMPDWAVEDGESFLTKFPSPLFWIKLDKDHDGYPTQESCVKRNFGIYYATIAVENAFENLYTNKNGIADNFKLMWMHIVKRFKDYNNVIGYEIFNEPFIGNLYKNPLTVLKSDLLLNFYKKIHEGIREIDDNGIIFYEAPTTDQIFDSMHGSPGGDIYNDRQIFSYHVYGYIGDPKDLRTANRNCQKFFKHALKKLERENVMGMLTEFGAISGKESVSIDNMNFVLDLADTKLHSWAYWQYKYYGDYTTAARPSEWEGFFDEKANLITKKVMALSRPYVSKSSAEIINMYFDYKNFKLKVEFSNKENSKVSIFNISGKYYNKFTAFYINCKDCALTKLDENTYQLDHSSVSNNTKFSVEFSFDLDEFEFDFEE